MSESLMVPFNELSDLVREPLKRVNARFKGYLRKTRGNATEPIQSYESLVNSIEKHINDVLEALPYVEMGVASPIVHDTELLHLSGTLQGIIQKHMYKFDNSGDEEAQHTTLANILENKTVRSMLRICNDNIARCAQQLGVPSATAPVSEVTIKPETAETPQHIALQTPIITSGFAPTALNSAVDAVAWMAQCSSGVVSKGPSPLPSPTPAQTAPAFAFLSQQSPPSAAIPIQKSMSTPPEVSSSVPMGAPGCSPDGMSACLPSSSPLFHDGLPPIHIHAPHTHTGLPPMHAQSNTLLGGPGTQMHVLGMQAGLPRYHSPFSGYGLGQSPAYTTASLSTSASHTPQTTQQLTMQAMPDSMMPMRSGGGDGSGGSREAFPTFPSGPIHPHDSANNTANITANGMSSADVTMPGGFIGTTAGGAGRRGDAGSGQASPKIYGAYTPVAESKPYTLPYTLHRTPSANGVAVTTATSISGSSGGGTNPGGYVDDASPLAWAHLLWAHLFAAGPALPWERFSARLSTMTAGITDALMLDVRNYGGLTEPALQEGPDRQVVTLDRFVRFIACFYAGAKPRYADMYENVVSEAFACFCGGGVPGVFAGFINRSDTETAILNAGPGAFVLRFSSTVPCDVALSYLPPEGVLQPRNLIRTNSTSEGRIVHELLTLSASCSCFVFRGQSYDSLSHLVAHQADVFAVPAAEAIRIARTKRQLCMSFHGLLTYEKTVARLRAQAVGAYLLRLSQSQRGHMVVAFVAGQGVVSQAIIAPSTPPGAVICSNLQYASLQAALDAYASSLLVTPVEPKDATIKVRTDTRMSAERLPTGRYAPHGSEPGDGALMRAGSREQMPVRSSALAQPPASAPSPTVAAWLMTTASVGSVPVRSMSNTSQGFQSSRCSVSLMPAAPVDGLQRLYLDRVQPRQDAYDAPSTPSYSAPSSARHQVLAGAAPTTTMQLSAGGGLPMSAALYAQVSEDDPSDARSQTHTPTPSFPDYTPHLGDPRLSPSLAPTVVSAVTSGVALGDVMRGAPFYSSDDHDPHPSSSRVAASQVVSSTAPMSSMSSIAPLAPTAPLAPLAPPSHRYDRGQQPEYEGSSYTLHG